MKLKAGKLYKIKQEFFDTVAEPLMKLGSSPERRPHVLLFKDSGSDLYWFAPCSTRIDKYQDIIDRRTEQGKPTDTIKIMKTQGIKQAISLIDMFPVSEEYISAPFIKNKRHLGISKPQDMQDLNKSARFVLTQINSGNALSPTQPDALRIKEIMLDEQNLDMSHEQPEIGGELQQDIEIGM